VDLLILGGGSAGFAAAIRGAELGARVWLVEGGTLGGTCVNVGCVPSKTLIRAAEALHRRRHHPFQGVPSSNGSPDWGAVRAQKDQLVAELRRTKYRDVLRSYEAITLFEQRGTVTSGPAIALADGSTLSAAKLIITTGASPWAAPIPGLNGAEYLDSTSAMALERLPASMIVIGGSAVGLELAQMFARLGVHITVVEALPSLLPAEDPALGAALAGYLEAEGLRVVTGTRIERVERHERGYVLRHRGAGAPQAITAEQLLVATGRRANTAGLGLENVGVALGPKGEVTVDEHLRTANPDVYAAGDVIGDPMLVYVAAYAGTTAAGNALKGDVTPYDVRALPRVTFTDPAVASVGLTAGDARAKGIEPLATRLSLEHVPLALAARDTRGFVQLVADAPTRQLIGAQILAPEAGDLISEAALAVRLRLSIEDLVGTFHPYLTRGEALRLAALTFTKDVATLSCCAG
jgi:mercuric reductase